MNNIYSDLIKTGVQPEDIKEMIIEEFDDFFINKEILEKNAINSLLPELINFIKLNEQTKFYNGFIEFLDILNTAKTHNSLHVMSAIEKCYDAIEMAHHKYWIIYSLDRDRLDLNLEQFSKYTFDQIKDIIEIMIKPYCSYVIYNIYIVNGEKSKFSSVNEMNLGKLVNEITQKNYLMDIFNLKIWTLSGEQNIKLNTLRNIGAHNDYIVIKDKIICDIRNYKNEIIGQLKLKREDLQKILVDVFSVFRALKLGYTLFFIDNVEEINKRITINLECRKEQLILNTFFGIQSQGFKIMEFIDSQEKSKIILLELLEDRENIKGAIHSSQFLYYLWEITKSNKNIIEYRDKNNKPIASFEINGEFCEKIGDGSIQSSDIVSEMKIIHHNL